MLLHRIETRRGIAAIADQAIVSATNFFTGAIIARACSKETFGVYVLGFTIVLLLTGTQDSLILSPYTVFHPRLKDNDGAQYAGSTLIHQFAFSALAILFLGVTGIVISTFGIGPQELAPVVGSLAFVITFILLREYARRFCFANLRMNVAIVIDSCVSVTQIVGLLLLYYTGMLSAWNAYWVIGFACGLISLVWLIWTNKRFILRLRRSVLDFVKNWSFGKWLFAGNITYLVGIQLYPWILTGFHGPETAGTFAACFSIVSLVNPFIIGISNFIGPKMAHAYVQGIEELRQVVLKTTSFLVAVIGIFCMAMFFYGDLFVVLIYGTKYAGNGIVVVILALSTFSLAVATPLGYALRAMERPDVAFKANFIQLAITVTLGLWFAKVYGPLGAACILLLGSLTTCAVTYLYYSSHTRHILLEK